MQADWALLGLCSLPLFRRHATHFSLVSYNVYYLYSIVLWCTKFLCIPIILLHYHCSALRVLCYTAIHNLYAIMLTSVHHVRLVHGYMYDITEPGRGVEEKRPRPCFWVLQQVFFGSSHQAGNCVFVYVHIHTYTYIYIYTHAHIYIWCIYPYICISHIYIHTHICVYLSVHAYVYQST